MDATLLDRILELAISIQQIPAPTFEEGPRAAFVRDCFLDEDLTDVRMDSLSNVYACLPGEDRAPPLVITAHTDTVFPAGTDLKVTHNDRRVYGPGLGDNALGVASLLGLVWALRQEGADLPGDLHLVANVGEEGLGDLQGMQAVVDHFGDRPLAYIVLEGMALGHIFHRGMGVQRYRIGLQTSGGHSWVDHGRPSAIHEMAHLINRLTALPLPDDPRTILNVGVASGGTSVNTIAAHAEIEVDLRSEDEAALEVLVDQVKTVARGTQRRDLKVSHKLIGHRPASSLPADHPLVCLAVQCLEAVDISPQLNVGSTDANLPLSRGLAAVCVGLTTGGGAHTLGEHIDIDPLAQGVAQLLSLVKGAHKALAG